MRDAWNPFDADVDGQLADLEISRHLGVPLADWDYDPISNDDDDALLLLEDACDG